MKEKKLLELKQQLGGNLIAVYAYETKQGTIPVFVLEKVDFRILSEIKPMFKDEKCIILSRDDLINGHDVFPLKLLHIRNHSSLSTGKDILKDIDFKKSDLLKTIELELRTKMVQLREDYLSDSFSDFVDNIVYFVQVVWEGIAYIHDEHTVDKKALESFIDETLKCDGKIFKDLYTPEGKKRDPLHVVSDINLYLEDLCGKIDSFTL